LQRRRFGRTRQDLSTTTCIGGWREAPGSIGLMRRNSSSPTVNGQLSRSRLSADRTADIRAPLESVFGDYAPAAFAVAQKQPAFIAHLRRPADRRAHRSDASRVFALSRTTVATTSPGRTFYANAGPGCIVSIRKTQGQLRMLSELSPGERPMRLPGWKSIRLIVAVVRAIVWSGRISSIGGRWIPAVIQAPDTMAADADRCDSMNLAQTAKPARSRPSP